HDAQVRIDDLRVGHALLEHLDGVLDALGDRALTVGAGLLATAPRRRGEEHYEHGLVHLLPPGWTSLGAQRPRRRPRPARSSKQNPPARSGRDLRRRARPPRPRPSDERSTAIDGYFDEPEPEPAVSAPAAGAAAAGAAVSEPPAAGAAPAAG